MKTAVGSTEGESEPRSLNSPSFQTHGCIPVSALAARPKATAPGSSGVRARARPVGAGAIVFAEVGSADLQQGFGTALDPKLLRAFDAPVDLLDRGLHRRAAGR